MRGPTRVSAYRGRASAGLCGPAAGRRDLWREPLSGTPRDYLFYSGGGGTVRGQPYQSLGVNVLSPDQTDRRHTISSRSRPRCGRRSPRRSGSSAFMMRAASGGDAVPRRSEGGWQSGAGLGVRYADRLRADPVRRGGAGHGRYDDEACSSTSASGSRSDAARCADPWCSLLRLPAVALAQKDDPGILTRFLQDNLSGAGRQVTITGFQGALSSRRHHAGDDHCRRRGRLADAEGRDAGLEPRGGAAGASSRSTS